MSFFTSTDDSNFTQSFKVPKCFLVLSYDQEEFYMFSLSLTDVVIVDDDFITVKSLPTGTHMFDRKKYFVPEIFFELFFNYEKRYSNEM